MIGSRRLGQDNSRTKVADLLRLNEQSTASNKLAQDKLISDSQYRKDVLGQRSTEAGNLADYRDKNLALGKSKLGLEIQKLDSLDEDRKARLGIRGQELEVAKSKLKLDETLNGLKLAAAKAKATNNTALQRKYNAEANQLETSAKIANQWLSGQSSSGLAEDIARDYLGLGSDKSINRLLNKDTMSAKLAIIENKDDKARVSVLLDRLYKSEPKATTMWYWNSEPFDEEATSAQLPIVGGKQVTVDEVLNTAKNHPGVSVIDVLKSIGAIK